MSTKYEENHTYKLCIPKFEEVSREVLQGAVLSTAIIIIFSTHLDGEIENAFSYQHVTFNWLEHKCTEGQA